MTDQEMRNVVSTRNAVLSELNRIGLRPLEGAEDAITKWFADKGVVTSTANGFLEMKQTDGSDVVPSKACTTLRTEHPEFFASNIRFDKISSLEDFNRGTETERRAARAAYISEHGLSAFEHLPRTKAEAELKSCEVGPNMTRKEYLMLSLREKARLSGVLGPDAIAVIMGRRG